MRPHPICLLTAQPDTGVKEGRLEECGRARCRAGVRARLDALPVAEEGLQLRQRLQPLGLRALDEQVQVALVARRALPE